MIEYDFELSGGEVVEAGTYKIRIVEVNSDEETVLIEIEDDEGNTQRVWLCPTACCQPVA